MKHLTKYESSAEFKAALRETTGFCLDNPDQRFPTRNLAAEKILAARVRNPKDHQALLLGAKNGRASLWRNRVFPWLAPLVGLAAWPDEAVAGGRGLAANGSSVIHNAGDWALHAWEWSDMIADLDWIHPGIGTATGLLIVATQCVGIWQRRKLAHALLRDLSDDQPDLFPETMVQDDPPPKSRTKWHWEVDADSLQGKVRKENQDAHSILEFEDGQRVLMVFDGAGGIEGGREAVWSAAGAVEEYLQSVWVENETLSSVDLETAIEKARQIAKDRGLSGATTALLVLLDGDQMHYATLGDGTISIIWPDGMIGPVQVPHHTAGQPSNIINAYIGGDCSTSPRTGSLRLETGATVLALTDGASDLFPFEDFALKGCRPASRCPR